MRYVLAVLTVVLGTAGCQSKPAGGTQAEVKPYRAIPDPAQATPAPDADAKVPPEAIYMPSPYGDVTFTHKKHYQRVNDDCSVCHPKVFSQTLEPINYRKALHRAAEASRTACAYCHAVGGSSFAADSNCIKCHVREYPKP